MLGRKVLETPVTPKTSLDYFVSSEDAGWCVRCEEQFVGPFACVAEAVTAAIGEAKEAGRLGFLSRIFVRSDSGRFVAHWAYGQGLLPPSAGDEAPRLNPPTASA